MIRVLGTTKTVCGGFSRREMLRIGGLSLLGLNLPQILRAEQGLPANPGRNQAKSVILLYLFGGPAAQGTEATGTAGDDEEPAKARGQEALAEGGTQRKGDAQASADDPE